MMQALWTYLAVFLAGFAAAWLWLRHALGYVSSFEAEMRAKLSEVTAHLTHLSRPPASPPPAVPVPPPAVGPASDGAGAPVLKQAPEAIGAGMQAKPA